MHREVWHIYMHFNLTHTQEEGSQGKEFWCWPWREKTLVLSESKSTIRSASFLLISHIISYLILTYYLSELTSHIFLYFLFLSCHQLTRRTSSRRSLISARSVKPPAHLRFHQHCRGLGPLNNLQRPQPDLNHPFIRTLFQWFSVV